MTSAELKRELAAKGVALSDYFLGLFREGGLMAADDFATAHPDLVWELDRDPYMIRLRADMVERYGEAWLQADRNAWVAKQLKAGLPDA